MNVLSLSSHFTKKTTFPVYFNLTLTHICLRGSNISRMVMGMGRICAVLACVHHAYSFFKEEKYRGSMFVSKTCRSLVHPSPPLHHPTFPLPSAEDETEAKNSFGAKMLSLFWFIHYCYMIILGKVFVNIKKMLPTF